MSIARVVVRGRTGILAAWLVAAALLVPRAATLRNLLDVGARIEGSESAAVEALLAGPLASPLARTAVLVVSGLPPLETTPGADALRRIVEPLSRAPDVRSVHSWLESADTIFQAPGSRSTFVVVGLVPERTAPDQQIARLRRHTATIEGQLRPALPGVTLRWTGETALNVDLRHASGQDVERAERRALPVTAGLLLLAFGALAAALLPVAAGALAIAVALGAAATLAPVVPLSILLQSVVSMLGLGLGIDYALLMVSRFREGLEAGLEPEAAAEAAARHAGHTILLSASTVALGFLALLVIPLNEVRSVGVGGLLVVTTSALLATTLLPGVLAWLGPRVDWGRVWRGGHRATSERRWRRLGEWVTGHPWTALLAGGAPLLLLAWQAASLRPGLPSGNWLPRRMESAQAIDVLQEMGRAGVIQRIRVVVELPEGSSVRRSQGWAALSRVADSLAADPRIALVRSAVGVARVAGMGRSALVFLPPETVAGLVSEDGRLALVDLFPREELSPSEVVTVVRTLRASGPRLTGVAGSRLLVGGLPAFNADYQDVLGTRFGQVVVLVVGGILVALLAGFRSVLVPIKAVGLNLLSVGAALGALAVVFQQGHGAAWFGVTEPLEEVFSSLPVIVFCIVFGLSMDYEVFLMSRVLEARRAGHPDREAIVLALGSTGQVITSAAGVMLAVFAAFSLGEVLLTQMLGFALAIAVLLDATVVRMVVGPALLQLAGRYNWWPGR